MKKQKMLAQGFLLLVIILIISGCGSSKTGKIFTTEYDIEDYCEDAIIVSKNDGKVYGLLDNNGKEILALDYDDIYFLNKDEYVNSEHTNLYLKAKREGDYTIFDISGNEILKTSDNISCLPFTLDSDSNDKDTPAFYEVVSNSKRKYRFYNENLEPLSEVENHLLNKIGDTIWLSNKCYIDWTFSDVTIYNYNGKELQHFDKGLLYKYESENAFFMYLSSEGEVPVNTSILSKVNPDDLLYEVILDADGNISSSGMITLGNYSKKYETNKQDSYKTNKNNKPYNLYTTNGTYKLEDWDGNALYEERYFESLSPSGENDCIALTNEDNQICIIGRNGIKYIDFGLLEYKEGDKDKIYMLSKNEKKEVKEIYEGKKSIIIPIKTENGFDIYYYGEIKK